MQIMKQKKAGDREEETEKGEMRSQGKKNFFLEGGGARKIN